MFTKTFSYSISFIILNIFVHSISSAQGTRTEYEIRLLKESDRNSYIVLSAPAALSGVVDFEFPATQGVEGQVLTINSAGKLVWATPAAASAPAIPPGAIMQYAGASNAEGTEPLGWLICDGRAVERAIYAALFAVIGTTYGAGDGSTTFNLPDMRAKFPLGKDATKALGAVGGAETVILTVGNLPSHNHIFYGSSEGANGAYNALATGVIPARNNLYLSLSPNSVPYIFKPSASSTSPGNKKALGEETISETGGDQPHNNMPPYIVVNYIIKY